MAKKPSLKDIAKRAGVSTTLVSYVLNNQKSDRINKETARKIRQAAEELNYRANQIARSLKTRRTFTIGLILADISNPFSSGLARIIEDEADKYNYTVLFGSSDENPVKFEKLVGTFLNRQVDGLIIAPPEGGEKLIEDIQKHQVPLVLVDRFFPGINSSYVLLDNFSASYEAVEHLIGTGRNNIGIITYNSSLFHLQERNRGYLSAMKKNGIRARKNWIREVSIENETGQIRLAVEDLLSAKPQVNAIIFMSNLIALQALKYLNLLPVKVPEELALISFDETDALELFYSPPTCIRQPLGEMGRRATHMLLDAIGKNNTTTQVVMKAELLIRESTQPLPR